MLKAELTRGGRRVSTQGATRVRGLREEQCARLTVEEHGGVDAVSLYEASKVPRLVDRRALEDRDYLADRDE